MDVKNHSITAAPKLSGSPEFKSYGDQVVIKKAVSDDWPVTPDMRARVLDAVTDALTDLTVDHKTKLIAGRTLLMADGINLKRQEVKIKSQPKIHIHGHASREEIIQQIRELTGVKDETVDPKAAAIAYLEHKIAGEHP